LYRQRLKKIPGIRLAPPLSSQVKYNHGYFPIEVDEDEFGMSRDHLYEKLKEFNVFSRRYFYPLLCDYACYRSISIKDPLTVARRAADRILALPIYDGLQLSDVETICEIIMSLQMGKDSSLHRRRLDLESEFFKANAR
jgi:dTDP-4-amino-4,6-dideoxygalactose transaminase